MSDEDIKSVLAKYQQKSFDLFNKTIVMEVQIEQLSKSVDSLQAELDKVKKSRKTTKTDENFD